MALLEALRARWRGELPLATVFWTDMLTLGTALNLATTLGAMLMLSAGAPPALVAAVFLAPLPVNVFLLVSVWRSTAAAAPGTAAAARGAAVVWFALATSL